MTTTPRVTISKSGHLYVIKKGGREVAYARTKMDAKKTQEMIVKQRDIKSRAKKLLKEM